MKRRLMNTAWIVAVCTLFFLIEPSYEAGLRSNGEPIPTKINEDQDFAITLDLGSSHGSVYVYTWPAHHDDPTSLVPIHILKDASGNVLYENVKPGIASTPEDLAFSYVEPLLQFAKSHVPEHKHSSTALYLLGTAGLRLLNDSKKDAIFEKLLMEIPKHFNFVFARDHMAIIDGKEEAVYRWLAVNYQLDQLKEQGATTGIMEMGGASLQIAFEVPKDVHMSNDFLDNVVDLKSNIDEEEDPFRYSVYAKSFLGFGSDKQFHSQREALFNQAAKKGEASLLDDCLPKGFSEHVKTEETGEAYRINGTGKWGRCVQRLSSFIRDLECEGKPSCIASGLPVDGMEDMEFYGFASFWYVVGDFFNVGKSYKFTELVKKSKEYCNKDWNELLDELKTNSNPYFTETTLSMQCFKSAWSAAVIHYLFHFSHSYKHLVLTQKVDGSIAPWTMGAILYNNNFSPQSHDHSLSVQPSLHSFFSLLPPIILCMK